LAHFVEVLSCYGSKVLSVELLIMANPIIRPPKLQSLTAIWIGLICIFTLK
jgi:hypothetical protein